MTDRRATPAEELAALRFGHRQVTEDDIATCEFLIADADDPASATLLQEWREIAAKEMQR